MWRWAWVAGLALEYGWTAGAEIGVKRGHFSIYLVDHVPGLKMIAIDTWEQVDGVSQVYERYRHKENYLRFMAFAHGRPIEVKRTLAHDIARFIPDGSLDFAFIDASHEYESVAQDIDDWKIKVRHMLMGHDWDNPDVKRAVSERFSNVIEGPDQCWAVRI